ncbi:DUF305 domain-containing protein [Arthrobacter sp. CAL618]|uniref:DUF305 domain-containing protein n=1 Tax=Arthrobacter sp. CAL618 TaxID=1055770 RepID=UPI0003F858AA
MAFLALLSAGVNNPEVKSIAYDMATAQQAQIGHMYTWLQNWNLPQSSPLEPMAWMERTGEMGLIVIGSVGRV